MGKVYAIIENLNLPARYYGTKKDALYAQRQMGEPEPTEALDAAGECNRPAKEVEEPGGAKTRREYHFKEFVAVCPNDLLGETREGRRVVDFLRRVDSELLASGGL